MGGWSKEARQLEKEGLERDLQDAAITVARLERRVIEQNETISDLIEKNNALFATLAEKNPELFTEPAREEGPGTEEEYAKAYEEFS